MMTYELTTGQGNILAMQRFYPDTAIGNQGMAVIYHEPRDPDLLEQAVIQTIKMHEGLRMRMTQHDTQYISDEVPEYIERKYFNSRAELDEFASRISKQPLTAPDTAQFVFYLFDLCGKQGIYTCMSHMICDATTSAICILTIEQRYESLQSSISSPLPVLPSYTDFIRSDKEYLSSERFEKDKAFWKEFYQTKPCSSRINAAETSSPAADRYEHRLSDAAENALHRLVNEWNVTPAVAFETIMTIHLHRVNTDHSDVTIAVPIHNRKGSDEKHTAGMRVLTLPLTVPAAAESTVFEWAKTVKRIKNRVICHRKYPLSMIQEHLRSLGAKERLYHVMVNYHSAKIPQIFETAMYSSGANESALCLHIDDRYNTGKHMLTLDYQTEIFPDRTEVELLVKRIEHMLCQCAADRDLRVSEIEIVSPEEKALIEGFGNTAVAIPDCCVHTLFEQAAKKYPDREAVIFRGKATTYRELERQSAAAAAFLQDRLTPEEIVPVIAKRSEVMIAVMLGILRMGCAFMLVDPNYPAARISQMIADARSSIALTDNKELDIDIPCIDISGIDLDNIPADFEDKGSLEDICYVVFTSGSTGQPKGISISHRSAVNYITPDKRNILGKCIPIDARKIMSITNPIFDIFITETLLPLANGMTVILADEQESTDPKQTAELMLRYEPEILQTTPTRLKLLLGRPEGLKALATLRSVLVGGERFPAELLDIIKNNSTASVMNVYGPSEATVWCSADDVTDGDITIGLPVMNTQILVLDENRRLMPIGAAGELCISGAGLSKGYLSRPELTQKQFVQSPFGGKMYLSGDMAYRRCDGKLVFLGRRDGQVKLRGQRIELGEIEAAMSDFKGIELSAAAVHEIGGRQILCGYYTADDKIDEDRLRAQMRCRLPVHMVPQLFRHMTDMPMTASGKTDRKALPVLTFDTGLHSDTSRPRTRTEKIIAKLWQEQLGAAELNRDDDFFHIGGDSLAAISFVSGAEEHFGINMQISDLFENSELYRLAEWIDSQNVSVNAPKSITVTGTDRYRLMPQQAAHYRFYLSEPDSLAYHIGFRLPLDEKTDRARLKAAIENVIRFEKVFNCYIEKADSGFFAVYDPAAKIRFEHYDNEKDFRRPFDLGTAPLVHLGDTDDSLLIDIHHIVMDGVSLDLLFKRIANAYLHDEIVPQKQWYGDYAGFFEGIDFSDAYAFFEKSLSGNYRPIKLPESDTGLDGGETVYYPVPDELYIQMKYHVKAHKLSMTALTLAAYASLLADTVEEREIFTMLSFQNRSRQETSEMIGMFSTSQPVHITVVDDREKYLDDVKEQLFEQYRYQELPMDMIAENVDISGLPQIDTAFIYQPEQSAAFPDDMPVPQPLDTGGSVMHMTLKIYPNGDSCSFAVEYKRDRYERSFIDMLAGEYISTLYRLTSDPCSVLH